MTTTELVRSVQYTVDREGRVTAVVVEFSLWQQIIAALEDAEDRALVAELRPRLNTGPVTSGALRWEAISDKWQ